MLLLRLEDLANAIFLLYRQQALVSLAHSLFRVDVQPVVVEQWHLLTPTGLHHDIDMITAAANQHGA